MGKQCLRTVYGTYIAEKASRQKNIIALEADLRESTQSALFQKAHPERYIDVGIAEQNMVGIAAGLALAGKIPVVHSFACFISMRSCEQVRTSIAYPNLNVKFVVTHGGISTGTAGTTHHAIEDIAIMRAIPNMTVFVPGDAHELRSVVDAALEMKGPVYIRLGAGEAEDVYGKGERFAIGKANRLADGDDVTIITTGYMAAEGLKAAQILAQDHAIKAGVVQMASIKPIDHETVVACARKSRLIVTLEEHTVIGGLGSAVCEVAAGIKGSCRVICLGIKDHFCSIGSAACLLKKEGLTAEQVMRTVVGELTV